MSIDILLFKTQSFIKVRLSRLVVNYLLFYSVYNLAKALKMMQKYLDVYGGALEGLKADITYCLY